jgi:outer membrane receptor protein involved in Fe transport
MSPFIRGIALAAIALPAIALSQAPSGAVTGTVRDDDGRPLPGVTVELRLGPGVSFTAFTSAADAYAFSNAPASSADVVFRLPGAIEGVASAGVSVNGLSGFSGSLRLRYFGPRALIENDSVRSSASTLVNARLGYQVTPNLRFTLDVFNVFDQQSSDVDYFYTSRLPGEPLEGVEDIHTHPVDRRTFRGGLSFSF